MMRKKLKRRMLSLALAASTGMLTVGPMTHLQADERPSSMYEDDGWYDVTEWFDGNDYNPTDERWFHWDNETYEASAAAKSSDRDNDVYGFFDSPAEDWYYDYDYGNHYAYDDNNSDGSYETSTSYFDYDNDGYYDAYASFRDDDGDGTYDTYTYLSFASADYSQEKADRAEKEAKSQASNRNSKSYSVTGKVADTKELQSKEGKRLIAHVMNQGQKIVVDLGPTEEFGETEISQGQQLMAQGPVMKVGDKNVLLAQKVELNGKSVMVDRSPRQLSGTVTETMRATPRKDGSTEHLMVKLKTDEGKHALVDLGPAKNLNMELQKDQKIDVSGVAVKIKERPVLLAKSAKVDGKEISVQRGSTEGERQASKQTSTRK